MMSTPSAAYQSVKRTPPADYINQHASLVQRIAHHLAARLPASVEVDDLVPVSYTHLTLPTNREV